MVFILFFFFFFFFFFVNCSVRFFSFFEFPLLTFLVLPGRFISWDFIESCTPGFFYFLAHYLFFLLTLLPQLSSLPEPPPQLLLLPLLSLPRLLPLPLSIFPNLFIVFSLSVSLLGLPLVLFLFLSLQWLEWKKIKVRFGNNHFLIILYTFSPPIHPTTSSTVQTPPKLFSRH